MNTGFRLDKFVTQAIGYAITAVLALIATKIPAVGQFVQGIATPENIDTVSASIATAVIAGGGALINWIVAIVKSKFGK